MTSTPPPPPPPPPPLISITIRSGFDLCPVDA